MATENILNLPTEETVDTKLTAIATALQGLQSGVQSVNGKTGNVNLTATDVGALSATTQYVQSVNGNSGVITGLATDNELEEVRQIALGASSSKMFDNYALMCEDLNHAAKTDYKAPQDIMIRTVNVPDLWISEVEEYQVSYGYTTDEALLETMRAQGYVQIGYFQVSEREGQKIIASEYARLDGADFTGNVNIGSTDNPVELKVNNVKIDPSQYVDLTSNQTIGGNKSFTGNIRVNSASNITDMDGTPLKFGDGIWENKDINTIKFNVQSETYKSLGTGELYDESGGNIVLHLGNLYKGGAILYGGVRCWLRAGNNYLKISSSMERPTYKDKQLSYTTDLLSNMSFALGYTLAERLNGLTLTDNSITELDYDHINKMTLSADRTFTFRAAPTSIGTNLSAVPEYRIALTTAAAVDITLPTGTYKFKTDDSTKASMEDNVISLATDTEYDIVIRDGKIICWVW